MTNCPNCGAAIDMYRYVKCPFCGTDYYDFAPMKLDEPFYMKFTYDGKTMIAKVRINRASLTSIPRTCDLYADEMRVMSCCSGVDTTFDIQLDVLEDVETSGQITLVENERS